MRQGGHHDIDVLLWDVDQRTADAFLVADTRFGELSYRDPARRRVLLESLEYNEGEFAAIGFLPDEIKRALAADKAELEVREVETGQIGDKFWIQIKGPLRQQAMALQRLRELMRDIDGVEVSLGTIEGLAEAF